MVFFNYTTMQVSAKIVYYGPGLCGKTTNLQFIHGRTDPSSRGEMVSLETEADRTLFFDLLPLEVGTIGGMRVRLQLYTVPGQVFYNTTRKLVLKGVDGVVFVADSQVAALDANLESLANLRQNLEELNQPFEHVPFVLQYNKRDLQNIHSMERLNRELNANGFEVFEAAALHGVGVFETLKAISKKTLAAVHRRISGQEPRRQRVRVPQKRAEHGDSQPVAKSSRTLTVPPVASPPNPKPDTSELRSNTAEVKVEFAASPDATPTSIRVTPPTKKGGEETVRQVATKSRVDVEKELDKLRRLAWGNRPPRPKAREAEPQKPAVSSEEPKHEVRLRVPRSALEGAARVALDLRLAGGSPHAVSDVLQVELPEHRPGQPTRIHVLLELEEE